MADVVKVFLTECARRRVEPYYGVVESVHEGVIHSDVDFMPLASLRILLHALNAAADGAAGRTSSSSSSPAMDASLTLRTLSLQRGVNRNQLHPPVNSNQLMSYAKLATRYIPNSADVLLTTSISSGAASTGLIMSPNSAGGGGQRQQQHSMAAVTRLLSGYAACVRSHSMSLTTLRIRGMRLSSATTVHAVGSPKGSPKPPASTNNGVSGVTQATSPPPVGLSRLASALPYALKLSIVDFSDTALGNRDAILLITSIAKLPCLREVYLAGCLLTDACADAVVLLLQCSVQKESSATFSQTLRSSVGDSGGGRLLAHGNNITNYHRNPHSSAGLTVLSLSRNAFSDRLLTLLSSSCLPHDRSLHTLLIDRNAFTTKGVVTLMEKGLILGAAANGVSALSFIDVSGCGAGNVNHDALLAPAEALRYKGGFQVRLGDAAGEQQLIISRDVTTSAIRGASAVYRSSSGGAGNDDNARLSNHVTTNATVNKRKTLVTGGGRQIEPQRDATVRIDHQYQSAAAAGTAGDAVETDNPHEMRYNDDDDRYAFDQHDVGPVPMLSTLSPTTSGAPMYHQATTRNSGGGGGGGGAFLENASGQNVPPRASFEQQQQQQRQVFTPYPFPSSAIFPSASVQQQQQPFLHQHPFLQQQQQQQHQQFFPYPHLHQQQQLGAAYPMTMPPMMMIPVMPWPYHPQQQYNSGAAAGCVGCPTCGGGGQVNNNHNVASFQPNGAEENGGDEKVRNAAEVPHGDEDTQDPSTPHPVSMDELLAQAAADALNTTLDDNPLDENAQLNIQDAMEPAQTSSSNDKRDVVAFEAFQQLLGMHEQQTSLELEAMRGQVQLLDHRVEVLGSTLQQSLTTMQTTASELEAERKHYEVLEAHRVEWLQRHPEEEMEHDVAALIHAGIDRIRQQFFDNGNGKKSTPSPPGGAATAAPAQKLSSLLPPRVSHQQTVAVGVTTRQTNAPYNTAVSIDSPVSPPEVSTAAFLGDVKARLTSLGWD